MKCSKATRSSLRTRVRETVVLQFASVFDAARCGHGIDDCRLREYGGRKRLFPALELPARLGNRRFAQHPQRRPVRPFRGANLPFPPNPLRWGLPDFSQDTLHDGSRGPAFAELRRGKLLAPPFLRNPAPACCRTLLRVADPRSGATLRVARLARTPPSLSFGVASCSPHQRGPSTINQPQRRSVKLLLRNKADRACSFHFLDTASPRVSVSRRPRALAYPQLGRVAGKPAWRGHSTPTTPSARQPILRDVAPCSPMFAPDWLAVAPLVLSRRQRCSTVRPGTNG